MRPNSQRGFTMIELIVVIVILGVLAAVAVPRMTNLQRDARVAKLNAARGAAAAAMAMVNGSAMARAGQTQPACGTFGTPNVAATGTGTICTPQGLVNTTLFYPTGSFTGIVAATGLLQGTATPTSLLLQAEGYDATIAAGVVTFQVTGGSAAATCSFTYTQATATAAAVISAVTTTGC